MQTDLKASIRIKTAVAAVTDPESSRYNLGDVRAVQGEQNTVWLSASDGRIAAAVPAEGFVQAPIAIPHEILPHRKKDFGPDGATVTLNGKWTLAPAARYQPEQPTRECEPSGHDGRFPAMSDLLHQLPADIVLCIDARRLLTLAEAINDGKSGNPLGCVTLLMQRDDDGTVQGGIRVVGDAGIGLIMPMSDERGNGRDLARYTEMSTVYRAAELKARETERAAKAAVPECEQPPKVAETAPLPPLRPRKRPAKPATAERSSVRELIGSAAGY